MVAARWRRALSAAPGTRPWSPTPMTRSWCGGRRTPRTWCGWRPDSCGARTPSVARRARAGSSSVPTATGRARAGSAVPAPTPRCAGTCSSPRDGREPHDPARAARDGATSPTPPWRRWPPACSVSTRPPRSAPWNRWPTSREGSPRWRTARRSVRLLLAKNPAGWTELLDLLEGGTDPVVIGINARIADGHDPSWLWDVPFERLAGRLVVATGERCRDLAVRLRHGGVAHVTVPDDLEALRAAASTRVEYVGNYTAFQDLRRHLAQPRPRSSAPGGRPAWRRARSAAPGMPVPVTVVAARCRDDRRRGARPSATVARCDRAAHPLRGRRALGAPRGGRAPGPARHLRRRRERPRAGRARRVARHPGGARPRALRRPAARRRPTSTASAAARTAPRCSRPSVCATACSPAPWRPVPWCSRCAPATR